MKFTAAITLALATAAAGQGFAHSCDHDSRVFDNGHNLKLTCTADDGSKKTTTLDLNKCFMNDGGDLRPRDNGKYTGTCRNCHISSLSSTVLYCDCDNQKGERNGAKIDLQKYLSSQDGKLCCGKHCGKESLVARVADSDEYHVFEITDEADDQDQEYVDPAALIFNETIFSNAEENDGAEDN